MFISLPYKKKKKSGKRESGLDRLTEGPNNHVQKVIWWEEARAGVRGVKEEEKNAPRDTWGEAMEKHTHGSYQTDLEALHLIPSTELVLPAWEQRTGDAACKELLHLADSQLLYWKDFARKCSGSVENRNVVGGFWVKYCLLLDQICVSTGKNESVHPLSALTRWREQVQKWP